MTDTALRRLPSVDRIVSAAPVRELEEDYPHELLVSLARQQLESVRAAIAAGKALLPFEEIVAAVRDQALALGTPGLRPIINASGVILHTNLGRAPLSRETVAAMEAGGGYCNLEFDIASGRRGTRNVHIGRLLTELTGAEAALVVNNNASAVLLALSALCKRQEVIISRDQAVEIGGGFRIPDVMRQSGAKLVDIGTTNCTYIADYEQAITPRTGSLMRIHSSNFKLVGFTHPVTLEEMVALGKRTSIPVFDDAGSGCFLDTTRFGLDPEPIVQQSVAAGASLVLFSGDKLLGGPQAGIAVGRRDLISRMDKHPLARAVRIDKVRLAGLVATLIHYLKGEALVKIPVWRMISASLEDIDQRAHRWAQPLGAAASIQAGESMVGGGSLPGTTLPTRLVAVGGAKAKTAALALNQALRRRKVPIIGRVNEDTLLLDPRSVLPEQDGEVLTALTEAASALESHP
jgi:L-seryl-tRNA(Ser) seleniumtransferase